jgi:signal transduction histidine kinase
MSHEIRTPLNAIIGLAHLATRAELPPKERDYVEKINLSAQTLLGMINDVLDFSKIEAGKLDIEEIGFSLSEVLDNVRTVTTQKAAEKGIDYHLEESSVPALRLVGDPVRLGQILINLASNAVKFTARGQVTVSARLVNIADNTAQIAFEVRDTGIGMTNEQQARIFQAFSQAYASTTRNYGGSGLGLTISHQLLQLMGSDLVVESTVGKGSAFRFTIRLPIDPKGASLPPTMDASLPTLARKRILLVEDNPINQQIATELLSDTGVIVDVVDGGAQALALLS